MADAPRSSPVFYGAALVAPHAVQAALARQAGRKAGWDDGLKKDASAEDPQRRFERAGSVAIVKADGCLCFDAGWLEMLFGDGRSGVANLCLALRAAADDPATHAVLLDVNSPGGTVAGVSDWLEAVAYVKASGKPLVGIAHEQADSAALWLISQCDRVYMTESAEIGSLGVLVVLSDESQFWDELGVKTVVVSTGEHKGLGWPGTPVTQQLVDDWKRRIAGDFDRFKAAVASGRGMSKPRVDAVADGRVFTSAEAVINGLADGVVGFDELVARLNENPAAMGTNVLRAAKASNTTTFAKGMSMAKHTVESLTNEAPDVVAQIQAAAVADAFKPFGGRAKVDASMATAAAATIEQLEKEFPGEDRFVLDQVKAGASLASAKGAFADVLKGRFAAAGEKLKTVEGELTTTRAALTVAEAKAKGAGGAEPLAGNPTKEADQGVGDPGRFAAAVKAKMDKDKCIEAVAVRSCKIEDPAGFDAWTKLQK